jgi:outer membrane protein OmpA-like peptidoglycan-associated protein
VDQLREQRRETREGDRTVIREPGRTIVREGDRTIIRHDETDRFRRRARDVRTERRGDEIRTIFVRPDGTRVITITDENGRLVRRLRQDRQGREIVIIDNRRRGRPGVEFGIGGIVVDIAPPRVTMPRDRYIVETRRADRRMIYETFIAPPVVEIERPYTLDEIRYTQNLRERMPRVDIDTITFDTGSWEIRPDQLRALEEIARAMEEVLRRNPDEVFLIEGYTDAVGSDIDNLSLSDRRAESVAVALSDEFGIPPENLVTQGYGEQFLKIPTDGPEEQNRRVTARRITPLLEGRVTRR